MVNRSLQLAALLAGLASSVNGQGAVSLASEECQDLFTGETEPFTKVGTVCPRIENGVIYFEVTAERGYNLEETHICNLPYTSPGDLHEPSYTIEIPESDAVEMVCGFDELEYLVAGHAEVYEVGVRNPVTSTAYFQVPLECSEPLLAGTPEEGVLTPPDGDCLTVFGYTQNNNYCFPNRLENPEENCAVCFTHYASEGADGGVYRDHHRWGWVLGGFERTNQYYRMIGQPQRTYAGELWGGAHDCDTRLGNHIGAFEIDYRSQRRKVVVNLETFAGWKFVETHVWASNNKADFLPKDENGVTSLLPRHYNSIHEGIDTTYDSHVIDSRRTVYIIVHGVVCPVVPE